VPAPEVAAVEGISAAGSLVTPGLVDIHHHPLVAAVAATLSRYTRGSGPLKVGA